MLLTLLLGSLPSQALSPYRHPFDGHPLKGCADNLEQQQIVSLADWQVEDFVDAVTQGQFAEAVLNAFPGEFTAANEAIGLTFDGETEVDQLLEAALEDRANPRQRVLRAQALQILTVGSNSPYQPNTVELLQNTFLDHRLIPRYTREGVATALVQGRILRTEQANLLGPTRTATAEDAMGYLCLATGRGNLTDDRAMRPDVGDAQTIPTEELRGVWLTNIDSDVLFSRERLEPALNTLADLNFNTVYPTVWNWGYTLFPSAVAERVIGHQQGLYPDLEDTGQRSDALEDAQGERDMLLELIEIAHPLGLRVMPWFEFGFMAPADSDLTRRHPEWLTQKRDGTLKAKEGRHPRVWMNPFHPEVQAFLLQMIGELAANYDIDGLQVDDHLGLPYEYGYDPYTVALYQAEHDGASPPADPKDAEWTRWRADKISEFMAKVFRVVKERRPDAVISVSPNPQEFAYEYYLQDWESWVQRGYVEELIIQLYRSDLGRFVWEMNRDPAEMARRHIPTGIGILSGLKGRPVATDWIAEQVAAVRDRNFAGVSFFFYETLWLSDTETVAEREAAFRQIFPNFAAAPSVETGWQSRLHLN
ncbi:MAG: glycoside hydrolase family 10 protein [Cyanobacteria bacterium J06628_6]